MRATQPLKTIPAKGDLIVCPHCEAEHGPKLYKRHLVRSKYDVCCVTCPDCRGRITVAVSYKGELLTQSPLP